MSDLRVEEREVEGGRLTRWRLVRPFHDWRHSAITNDAAADNSGLAVMKRAGRSDFWVTQQYIDLAGVDFADEAERAGARAFAQVPRAQVRAKVEAE